MYNFCGKRERVHNYIESNREREREYITETNRQAERERETQRTTSPTEPGWCRKTMTLKMMMLRKRRKRAAEYKQYPWKHQSPEAEKGDNIINTENLLSAYLLYKLHQPLCNDTFWQRAPSLRAPVAVIPSHTSTGNAHPQITITH